MSHGKNLLYIVALFVSVSSAAQGKADASKNILIGDHGKRAILIGPTDTIIYDTPRAIRALIKVAVEHLKETNTTPDADRRAQAMMDRDRQEGLGPEERPRKTATTKKTLPKPVLAEFAKHASYSFKYGSAAFKIWSVQALRRQGLDVPEAEVVMEGLTADSKYVYDIVKIFDSRDRHLSYINLKGIGLSATSAKAIADFLQGE